MTTNVARPDADGAPAYVAPPLVRRTDDFIVDTDGNLQPADSPAGESPAAEPAAGEPAQPPAAEPAIAEPLADQPLAGEAPEAQPPVGEALAAEPSVAEAQPAAFDPEPKQPEAPGSPSAPAWGFESWSDAPTGHVVPDVEPPLDEHPGDRTIYMSSPPLAPGTPRESDAPSGPPTSGLPVPPALAGPPSVPDDQPGTDDRFVSPASPWPSAQPPDGFPDRTSGSSTGATDLPPVPPALAGPQPQPQAPTQPAGASLPRRVVPSKRVADEDERPPLGTVTERLVLSRPTRPERQPHGLEVVEADADDGEGRTIDLTDLTDLAGSAGAGTGSPAEVDISLTADSPSVSPGFSTASPGSPSAWDGGPVSDWSGYDPSLGDQPTAASTPTGSAPTESAPTGPPLAGSAPVWPSGPSVAGPGSVTPDGGPTDERPEVFAAKTASLPASRTLRGDLYIHDGSEPTGFGRDPVSGAAAPGQPAGSDPGPGGRPPGSVSSGPGGLEIEDRGYGSDGGAAIRVVAYNQANRVERVAEPERPQRLLMIAGALLLLLVTVIAALGLTLGGQLP